MRTVDELSEVSRRRAAMSVCADADRSELDDVLGDVGELPAFRDIRRPETGLVMVRGRMGGDGAPFHFGEATVTRAVVAAGVDPPGFAYHLGRDVAKARAAASIDALWQDPVRRPAVEAALASVRMRQDEARRLNARRTAATRVDFFTLVRGED